ncbi:MAG: FHA domain-containing protein [Bryobacteraceae bacterium]
MTAVVSNVIEKLGKAIFEAPFGASRLSKDAPELAEIRIAMLDEIKAKTHRAGGKSVIPFTLLRIKLRGIPEAQAAALQGDFLAAYLTGEARESLKRSNYRFPEDLHVEIHTTPVLPSAAESWITVEPESRPAQDSAPPSRARKPAKLVVLTGAANQKELTLEKTRTNIGRTAEVFRSAGPSRRNDLAFTGENEANRTVSREHAHILYSPKTGEYRLFNDRWYKDQAQCGIWIVRDGLSQPVHRGTRGFLLKNADEVHLGNVVVRFQQK